MSDVEQSKPRPRWVRFAAPAGWTRRQAFGGMISNAIWMGICLFFVVGRSDSILGQVGLVVGLACVCLLLGLLVWTWLAIRWVDRNDEWS
jgi:hypothetical protein